MAEKTGIDAAITYVDGDATAPQGAGVKMIVHVCNDVGGWGKGFVRALSRRWPEPERAYRRWYRERAGNDFGLGAVQFVPVGEELWVANVIGQRGTARRVRGSDRPAGAPIGGTGAPVRYEAIAAGLGRVAERAVEVGASVHMPRIGCGLAGGTWSRMEPLISRRLVERGVAVTVYDG
ncbi:macro domain-containing protein [Streptomyces sp. NPDC056149]|uniref:macro domain-containing protein n=1 Tax=unclassified Streptomyces TaxID=2593676 RepID=UPI00238187D9|nr:macro domain-containing protein [Streptomyces sp. WZ-12]